MSLKRRRAGRKNTQNQKISSKTRRSYRENRVILSPAVLQTGAAAIVGEVGRISGRKTHKHQAGEQEWL